MAPRRTSDMYSHCTHRFEIVVGKLPAVGVHGGHDVDARGVDELLDVCVAGVLLTQVVDEAQEQLASHHLVTVHVTHILELGLTWGERDNMFISV